MSSLIPGLEAYMEEDGMDVDISIQNGVEPTEEVAQDQAEVTEDAAEVAEVAAESEGEEAQVEMIFKNFDAIRNDLDYISKFGVDRTYLALRNYNGALNDTAGIRFPACEAFDAIGSVNSPETAAVIRGCENALQGVWDFIKRICRKIADFASRIWEAVQRVFGGLDRQVKRLRGLLKNRVMRDRDEITSPDASIMNPDEVAKILKNVSFSSGSWNIAGKALGGLRNLCRGLIGGDAGKVKNEVAGIKTQLEDAKRAASKELPMLESKSVDLTRYDVKKVEAMLGLVEDCSKSITAAKKMIDDNRALARELEKTANDLKAKAKTEEKANELNKAASDVANASQKMSTLVNSQISRYMKIANGGIKFCSLFINRCMKPAASK